MREITDRNAADYVQVTVTPGDNGQFTVTITNVSETAATPSPIAPGVYAVHDDRAALFTLGDKPELRYRAARDGLAALGVVVGRAVVGVFGRGAAG